jgi:hypothetical protein
MIFHDLETLADLCDSDTKLAVTAWVFKHIVDHAREGGSYRYLIYQRLGFGSEAYVPLCDDGLTISNEFDLGLKDRLVEALKSKDEKKMKEFLGLCDEHDCFKYVSCGWSSENGYRTTCGDHYKERTKDV